jgi:hypothetical protein
MESLLPQCNLTELVAIAASKGIRTHRGVGREALTRAIIENDNSLPANPLDKERDDVMWALEEYKTRLRSQIQCHMNCYLHSDGHVARCAIKAERILDKARKEGKR